MTSKRGNLYKDSLYYKCFNGGCEVSHHPFFKHFGIDFYDILNDEEVNIIIESKSNFVHINYSLDYYSDINIEKLFLKQDIIDKLKLSNVNDFSIKKYLNKRYQYNLDDFAWCDVKKQLYIFNTDKSGEYVMGLQIRNFNGGVKYLTYKYDTL